MSSVPSPAPRRRRDGARRRDDLLDAALRCFDSRGLLATGIEEIRKEAGASPSSVYNLFADRQAIVLALLIRVFDALFAHLAQRVSRARTAKGAVISLVDGHIEWAAEHQAEARFMYQAMTLVGQLDEAARSELAEHKAKALTPVLATFQPYFERGELPPWSPTMFDVVALGPAHEALRRWLAGADELHPDVLRKKLPALAWRAVQKS